MMPAPSPRLDNRSFQAIRQQLETLAAQDLPAWTPPSEGDSGTILQHIFARLMEITLERFNRVPEKNRLAFLDAMGVDLLAPSPARVPLTFGLTAGTPATRVPKGSQAVSEASEGQPASIFETDAALTVIPARVTMGFTIDPTWDRYHDQTSALSGSKSMGFTPFVGTSALPQSLFLGDPALLNFVNAVIDVDFKWNSQALSLDALKALLDTLQWEIDHQGQPITLSPLPNGAPLQQMGESVLVTAQTTAFRVGDGIQLREGNTTESAIIAQVTSVGSQTEIHLASNLENPYSLGTIVERTSPLLRFADVGAIDSRIIQGVSESPSLRAGRPSRWLQATLTAPLPDTPVAQDLRLRSLSLRVHAGGRAPDLAFSNTAPVDITKDFRPFGEIPQVGDAFYFGHEETFAKTGADVTLHFQAGELTPRQLVWEYFSSEVDDWQPLQISGDLTDHLMHDGRILGVARRMGTATVNGVSGLWVRVRLAASYRMAPKLKSFRITPALPQGSSANELPPAIPPIQMFANEDEIDIPINFYPLGKVPSVSDKFYFREPNGGFPQFPSPDNTFTLVIIDVEIDDDRSDAIAPATLRWEYLGSAGWAEIPSVTDTTESLLTTGEVTFTMPETVRSEVNGLEQSWLRVRLGDSGYGREAAFTLVDQADAAKGFKLREGTGPVISPLLQSLHIDYSLQRTPSILTQNGFLYHDRTADNATSDGLQPFIPVQNLQPAHHAEPTPAIYLGLDDAFPEQPVTLYVVVTPRSVSGRVIQDTDTASSPADELAPLQWEYFNGTTWRELAMIDGTSNGTETGSLTFLTPVDMAPLARFDTTSRYWIRARSAVNPPADTQRWFGVFLNTVSAMQAETQSDETVGSSNGLPNQTLQLSRSPVLSGQAIWVREAEPPSQVERAEIEALEGRDAVQMRGGTEGSSETWVRWHEAPNLLGATPQSRHYTIDRASGQIRFGDGKRGLIPPQGTGNIRATYRIGGGASGNVKSGVIRKLQAAIAGVASVTNPVAAAGGAEQETIDMVVQRGPQTLRHRQRAVSSPDIEWLARQAAGTSVARAKCLPNINRDLRFEPGWMTLIIVPQEQRAKPSPSAELIRAVEDYLAPRAFAGLTQNVPTRLNVIGPGYVQVSVNAEIVPRHIAEAQVVKQRVMSALDTFFHPLTGGPQQSGWPFGRDIYDSELCQLLEGVDGVDYVKNLELVPNAAQHRLTFSINATATETAPADRPLQTPDARKAALLALPVTAGETLESVDIKGFKEGDRITRVHDLTVTQRPTPDLPQTQIEISTSGPLDMLYPRGSVLMTQHGRAYTHLQTGLQASDEEQITAKIEVEDEAFVNQLQVGDRLTVFYPFPMIMTSISQEAAPETQVIHVHPYELGVPFPAGSLIATLDNRVRLPLHSGLSAPTTVNSLTLEHWTSDTLPGVQEVRPVSDVVYIDDHFLVYPGVHRIHLVSE